jgi:acetate kinase
MYANSVDGRGLMHILVLNSGSSSIKFSIFESAGSEAGLSDPGSVFDGELSGIGSSNARLTFAPTGANPSHSEVKADSIADAIQQVFAAIGDSALPPIEAVGYRVVHPGPKIDDNRRITPELLADLEEAIPFAPLHNPQTLTVIRKGLAEFPAVRHYACFDTVFHRTMPQEAITYALPREYGAQGVRRYGFHGLSCEWIVRQLRSHAGGMLKRMVIAHLGSGCSVTALVDGRSVDTTMGMTPTGGVVMGTRPGDLDPGLILYFLRQQKKQGEDAVSTTESMLNHQSGMVALSGMPNDVRAMRKAAAAGDARALLALKVFTRSLTKAIGGFCWLMGGLDAIAFTGGIGEHDADTRREVLAGLQELGIAIDDSLNQTGAGGLRTINQPESRTSVYVIPAQEDRMIAVHVDRMARSNA